MFGADRCSPMPLARTRTEWVVRGSEGFDALSFLSPLSGDPFYLDYYRDQVAAFAPLMPADTMATLKAIVQRAQAAKILFSPFLDLRFSAGPDQTIDDFLASAAEPDARLMRGFRASPYWHDSENDWQQFKAALPALASILSAMKAAGFPEFLSRIEEPKRGRLEGSEGETHTVRPHRRR